MTEQYTQEQLEQIVAEIERLSSHQESELNRTQVEQIIQELGLPSELLNEAVIQLQRRQALQEEKRRKRLIGMGVIASLLGVIILTIVLSYNRQQALQQVSSIQDRITYAEDEGRELVLLERASTPMVYYRVTLQNAPIGRKLSLGCNWMNPNGQIVHQNRYETKRIDKEVWNTYCRYSLTTNAAVGTWEVKMLLGDKTLSSTSFQVK